MNRATRIALSLPAFVTLAALAAPAATALQPHDPLGVAGAPLPITRAAGTSTPVPALDTPQGIASLVNEVINSSHRVTVFLHVDGAGTTNSVDPMTVGEFLARAGVKMNSIDVVSGNLSDQVSDGMFIVVDRHTVKVSAKTVPVKFEAKKLTTPVPCAKVDGKMPESKVVVPGVPGVRTQTFKATAVNGKLITNQLVTDKLTKAPVAQETAECVPPKVTPVPRSVESDTEDARSSSLPDAGSTSSSDDSSDDSGSSSGGSQALHEKWMTQAGIPKSDWRYVDYIVERESNWVVSARNPSSSACSLAQFLRCESVIGPDWTNPVLALKAQYNYVTERYGGYAGAYNFWVANHWY